jgi:hypothetical protein
MGDEEKARLSELIKLVEKLIEQQSRIIQLLQGILREVGG